MARLPSRSAHLRDAQPIPAAGRAARRSSERAPRRPRLRPPVGVGPGERELQLDRGAYLQVLPDFWRRQFLLGLGTEIPAANGRAAKVPGARRDAAKQARGRGVNRCTPRPFAERHQHAPQLVTFGPSGTCLGGGFSALKSLQIRHQNPCKSAVGRLQSNTAHAQGYSVVPISPRDRNRISAPNPRRRPWAPAQRNP